MKAYTKPTIYVEKLGINHSITTCTVNITGPITGAQYDDVTDIIFGSGPNAGDFIDGCTVEMTDPAVLDFCLNAPVDATMVFQSN